MTGQSLLGKTILVTRPKEQAGEFTSHIERLGGKVVVFPTIEIVPPSSWDECDEAISRLESYDAIVFTSRHAVGKLIERIEEVSGKTRSVLAPLRIYAVGEKTEAALEEAGVWVTLTPDVYSAQELAESFRPDDVAGKRYLLPRGDIGKDILARELRAMGGTVHEVVVYRNIMPRRAELDGIRSALLSGEIQIVSFFSPSAARNFIEMMGTQCVEHTVIAAIGPSTAAAVRSIGLPVDIVSGKAAAPALAEAIAEFVMNSSPMVS